MFGGSENVEKEVDIYNLDQMSTLSRAEAIKMIENNDLLKRDRYTQTVEDNDFAVTRNNETVELNPGAFVCLRLAFLEQMRATATMDQARVNHASELEAAMVVHSGDRVVEQDGTVADTQ